MSDFGGVARLAFLLAIPIGAAFYFWRKTYCLERELEYLEDNCGSTRSYVARRDGRRIRETNENVRILNKELNETNLKMLGLMETVICMSEYIENVQNDNQALVQRVRSLEKK